MTTTTTTSWPSQVLAHEPDYYDPDVGYEFAKSSGRVREFKNSDKGHSGIYHAADPAYVLDDDYGFITDDDGTKIVDDDT